MIALSDSTENTIRLARSCVPRTLVSYRCILHCSGGRKEGARIARLCPSCNKSIQNRSTTKHRKLRSNIEIMVNMLLIYLFICFLGDVIMANAQSCYYPNGSVSSRDAPCHSPSIGDGASACCGYPDICLDNNLCLSQAGAEVVSRGSCTDETWQSPECPQYCSDGNYLS